MRQLVLPSLALLLGLAAATSTAQPLAGQDSLLLWGTIERLYSSHRLLVRADDNRLYTVSASGVPIELPGGDLGRWDDLRTGQQIEVFGATPDEEAITASHIRITGGRPTDRRYNDEYDDRYQRDTRGQDRYRDESYRRPGDLVELLGTVSSVDRERESIRLRTRRGLRTVELFDDTILRWDSGRRADLRDVHVGDELSVSGRDRRDRIVADRITVIGPSNRQYPDEFGDYRSQSREEAVLTGTVRGSTYYLSRRITVRTDRGDVTVEVHPNTPIYELGDRISVHELESGDRVRVVGWWNGSDRFVARRIAVSPRRSVRAVTGVDRAVAANRPRKVVTTLR